jgi:vacuolar-type H+-ATPase subunit E/Vma4
MTMNKLISSLVSDAKKEAEGIIRTAESDVEKLIAEEKAKRAILLREADSDCGRILEDQKRERVAWARLEARRVLAEAREDAINGTLGEMYTMLADLRKSPDYGSFVKEGVARAVSELGSEDELIVHVAKGDKKYVSKFKGEVREDLDAVGGVLVERADGKVCVNLTLESVLETRKDELRKKIYEKLFESKTEA